jgi:hypothetical protein
MKALGKRSVLKKKKGKYSNVAKKSQNPKTIIAGIFGKKISSKTTLKLSNSATVSVSINVMWFKISVLNYAVTWRVRILKLHDRDLKSFQNTLYCFIYPHKIFKSIKHIIMHAHFLRSTHRLPEEKVLKLAIKLINFPKF